MREWQSLAHVKWECKYHLAIVPKYRKKALFGRIRREIGKIIRQLCRQKEVALIEGHAMPDHVHLVLSVPPKYSICDVRWVSGRQVSHPYPSAVARGEEGLHREAFLVTWELLWRGDQYRRAIESYYTKAHAGVAATYPRTLEDLVKDPRSLQTLRHIRQLFKGQ